MEHFADLGALAEEIAARVGGSARLVTRGEYPAMAIAIDDRYLLLLRGNGATFSLSLPHDRGWMLGSRATWLEIAPEVVSALAAYRASKPRVRSIADVVVALANAWPSWSVSFPGVSVPTEAWVTCDDQSVGVFQRDDKVDLVVWVGSKSQRRTCNGNANPEHLLPWLEQQVVAQANARAAEVAEVARRKALPLPVLADVLAAMRAGASFKTGGGRWSATYSYENENGRLRCETFDEGFVETNDVTEDQVGAAIARDPEDFRR